MRCAHGPRRRTRRCLRPVAPLGVHHRRTTAPFRRPIPRIGKHHRLLLGDRGVRCCGQPGGRQDRGVQQDGPCRSRPRPGLQRLLPPGPATRTRRRPGHDRATTAAIDAHLQTRRHRGRGRLAPGCNVPLHRAGDGHGSLVRARRCNHREWLPVRTARRPPRPTAPSVPPVADAGVGTEFLDLDPTPLPELGDPSLVPLEVSKGSCVVLHGLLPHGSHPNRSRRSRQAYSVHLIDGRAEYPAFNWLQRPNLPLTGSHAPRPPFCAAFSTSHVENATNFGG